MSGKIALDLIIPTFCWLGVHRTRADPLNPEKGIKWVSVRAPINLEYDVLWNKAQTVTVMEKKLCFVWAAVFWAHFVATTNSISYEEKPDTILGLVGIVIFYSCLPSAELSHTSLSVPGVTVCVWEELSQSYLSILLPVLQKLGYIYIPPAFIVVSFSIWPTPRVFLLDFCPSCPKLHPNWQSRLDSL